MYADLTPTYALALEEGDLYAAMLAARLNGAVAPLTEPDETELVGWPR